MIPQSFVQELLSRVDIVDVIERYVPLKKSGANYFACCPFHGEKSASFSVSPSKQFYHCFGCGVHGSAVGFLMEYSGLGFVDAIKELAAQVGLQVPDDGRSAAPVHDDASERLYEAMAVAARFYRDQLKPSRPAIDYLKRRIAALGTRAVAPITSGKLAAVRRIIANLSTYPQNLCFTNVSRENIFLIFFGTDPCPVFGPVPKQVPKPPKYAR